MGAFRELPLSAHSARPYGFIVISPAASPRRFGPVPLPPSAWEAISDAKTWCLDQWGISNTWDYQHDVFTFTDKSHATMFKLRWC